MNAGAPSVGAEGHPQKWGVDPQRHDGQQEQQGPASAMDLVCSHPPVLVAGNRVTFQLP